MNTREEGQPLGLADAPDPDELRPGDPADLLLDVFLLLDRLGRLRVRLLQNGEPSRRLLASLDRPGDGPSPGLVFALAEEAGLVRVRGGFLRCSEGTEGFLRSGPVEQLRQLSAAWLETLRWDDLDHLSEDPAPRPGRRGRPPAFQSPRGIREALVARLAPLEPGSWHEVAELGPAGNGHLLAGPFRHLGLVDVTPGAGPATSFRVTELGAHLLGQGAPPAVPPAPRPLRVQPTFEVIQEGAGLAVDLGLALDLSLLGVPERGDRTIVYRLGRDEVTAAFHRGWSADRILRRLSETSARPVAQNLAFTLHQWEERSRRVTLHRRATLLEIDPGLLERLTRRRSVAEAVLARPAPGLVLLRASLASRITRHLRSREILVSRVDHQAAPGSRLRVDPEGRIRLLEDELDETAAGWLPRVARRARGDERADWRLLRSRVHRAATEGLSPERLARLLEARAGPLPPELRVRLMAWGGSAGEVRLDETGLCASPGLLGLLARISGIRELLHRSGADRAELRAGGVGRVSSRLRRLGLHVMNEGKAKKSIHPD